MSGKGWRNLLIGLALLNLWAAFLPGPMWLTALDLLSVVLCTTAAIDVHNRT